MHVVNKTAGKRDAKGANDPHTRIEVLGQAMC